MNVTNIYSNPLLLSITFYLSNIQTHVVYHSLRCSFTISGKTMKCIKSSFRPPCSSFDRTFRPRNRETIDVPSFPPPRPFVHQFFPTCPLQNSPLFPQFPGTETHGRHDTGSINREASCLDRFGERFRAVEHRNG